MASFEPQQPQEASQQQQQQQYPPFPFIFQLPPIQPVQEKYRKDIQCNCCGSKITLISRSQFVEVIFPANPPEVPDLSSILNDFLQIEREEEQRRRGQEGGEPSRAPAQNVGLVPPASPDQADIDQSLREAAIRAGANFSPVEDEILHTPPGDIPPEPLFPEGYAIRRGEPSF